MRLNTFYKSSGAKVGSIEDLLNKYGEKEFRSPFRSTIPLLCAFQQNKLPSISIEHDASFVFEAQTEVKKGKGYPSCTDLMITDQTSAICIEAKRTEPEYETVKEWNGVSENRNLVLEGWLEYISEHTTVSLEKNDILYLPYQLIHRLASACACKKNKTTLLYLVFGNNNVEYYRQSLCKISSLMKSKVSCCLNVYDLECTELQKKYEKQWNEKKERDFSDLIIDGIISNNLMDIKLVSSEIMD